MSLFRLLAIDDHPVVISGLRLLLAGSTRFSIVGEARTVRDALSLAEEHQPDVAVTDLVMGGNDRIAMVEDLLAIAPAMRVLVYSSSDERLWARHALRAGARGYVSKAEPLETVAEALEAIMKGAVHVSPAVQRLLVDDYASPRRDATDVAALSSRELQILTLMGDGRSPQSLGQELGLSVKTIGSYRERLKIKLGLETMRMLDRFAMDYAAGMASKT